MVRKIKHVFAHKSIKKIRNVVFFSKKIMEFPLLARLENPINRTRSTALSRKTIRSDISKTIRMTSSSQTCGSSKSPPVIKITAHAAQIRPCRSPTC